MGEDPKMVPHPATRASAMDEIMDVGPPQDTKQMLYGLVVATFVAILTFLVFVWIANKGKVDITEMCEKIASMKEDPIKKVLEDINQKDYADYTKGWRAVFHMRKVIESFKHEVNANREPSKVIVRCKAKIPGHTEYSPAFIANGSEDFLNKLIEWTYSAQHDNLKEIVKAKIKKSKKVMKLIRNLPVPAKSGDPMKMMVGQMQDNMDFDAEQIDTVNPDGSLRVFHEEHQKLVKYADSTISFPKGNWKALASGSGRSKQLNVQVQGILLGEYNGKHPMMNGKLKILQGKLQDLPEQEDLSILPWLNLKALSITIKRGFKTTKLDLPAVSQD